MQSASSPPSRTESLDWLLTLGRPHLKQILRIYIRRYNSERQAAALATSTKLRREIWFVHPTPSPHSGPSRVENLRRHVRRVSWRERWYGL
jgi:hypothetical protein